MLKKNPKDRIDMAKLRVSNTAHQDVVQVYAVGASLGDFRRRGTAYRNGRQSVSRGEESRGAHAARTGRCNRYTAGCFVSSIPAVKLSADK